jgi:hypothetical protein
MTTPDIAVGKTLDGGNLVTDALARSLTNEHKPQDDPGKTYLKGGVDDEGELVGSAGE